MNLLKLKEFLDIHRVVTIKELMRKFEVDGALLKYWIGVLNKTYGVDYRIEKQGYRMKVSKCATCHSGSCNLA